MDPSLRVLALVPVALLAASCASAPEPAPKDELTANLSRLRAPPGYRVNVFASGIAGARHLATSPSGTVYVGSRESDVFALRDEDGDGRAERVHVVASGLNRPNGVAFRDGSLYVGDIERILRLDGIEDRLDDPPDPVVVLDDLPSEKHHARRVIGFGPDGKLYVALGAPCNTCEPEEPRGTILRMNADGSEREVFARGVRNSVGFDWHPETEELWFTDNGRDWLGDELPADELNRAPQAGLHFGFPYCHGGDLPDPDFAGDRGCSDSVPPARKLGAHVAALGTCFYTGAAFPEDLHGQVFIAEHGSWNRTTKVGYRVSLVRLNGSTAIAYEPFVEGWFHDGEVWGRPVDVVVAADGALLVSDDHAGAVHRVSFDG